MLVTVGSLKTSRSYLLKSPQPHMVVEVVSMSTFVTLLYMSDEDVAKMYFRFPEVSTYP